MNIQITEKLSVITEEEQALLTGDGQIDKGLYQSDMEPGMQSERYVIDAKKLLDQGKLITIRKHTRFAHFPAHTHNYVEVIYMCSGQTHHVINGQDVLLKEGELLFLNQNSVQEIYPAGENDIAVNFIILPEFFDRALYMINSEESPLRSFILACMTGENKEPNYLHFQVAHVIPVQNLVENLIWTLMNPTQNKRSINELTMGLLFLQLLNYAESIALDPGAGDRKLILQVLGYAEEHYRDGELSELAKLMHYDMYWLSREIKRQTGQNYTEIVQTKRLSQACYLLKTTKKTVADIAVMVGYENVSYFHRLFQKRYGMSPRQYRAECK